MSNPPTGATRNANDKDAADPTVVAAMKLNTINNPYILVNFKRFIHPSQQKSANFNTAATYLSANENNNSVHTAIQAAKMKTLINAVTISSAEMRNKAGINAPIVETPLETKKHEIEGFGEDKLQGDRYVISVTFNAFAEKIVKTGMLMCSPVS